MPAIPSSAATVSGAVCDVLRRFDRAPDVSSRLAAGCDATPTPTIGWFSYTAHVSLTSVHRPLTTRSTEWSSTSVTKAAEPMTTKAITAIAISRRVRRPPARAVTRTVADARETMADCEYEK